MSDELRFEAGELPKRSLGRPSLWAVRLAPLVDKPGVWHRWPKPLSASMAAQIRRRPGSRPPGKWEFTARKNTSTGETYLWAMYVGPE